MIKFMVSFLVKELSGFFTVIVFLSCFVNAFAGLCSRASSSQYQGLVCDLRFRHFLVTFGPGFVIKFLVSFLVERTS